MRRARETDERSEEPGAQGSRGFTPGKAVPVFVGPQGSTNTGTRLASLPIIASMSKIIGAR